MSTLRRFKGYGLTSERIATAEITKLTEKVLMEQTDPKRLQRIIRDLRQGRTFASVTNKAAQRLEKLLVELPRMTVERAAKRRGLYSHLFDEVQAEARVYVHQMDELRNLLASPPAKDLLRNPKGKQMLEEQAQVIWKQIADSVDHHSELRLETGLSNELVKLLYPNDYASSRLDSHHVVEKRGFNRFRTDWKLLGWNTEDDMAAIAVLYEFHIRSPKRLPGIEQLGKDLDLKSLSKALEEQIDVDHMRDVFELLNAYKRFYGGQTSRYGKGESKRAMFLPRALPVLDAIERELVIRRSRRKLFRMGTKQPIGP